MLRVGLWRRLSEELMLFFFFKFYFIFNLYNIVLVLSNIEMNPPQVYPCSPSWTLLPPQNWCFWTVVLEETLESPLDCKEIQPVHSKGDQPWVFFGRNDAYAETPVLWPPHVKSWLIGKGSDAGRDWGQEEEGTTEDEMVGWNHRLDGHEFEWTLGDGDGQRDLVYGDSWGCKELDMTERLNWAKLN